MDNLVFPFPLDDGVTRHLAATARQKGSVNLGAGQSPIDPADGPNPTHEYNTSLKRKVQNVTQVGDLQERTSRVVSKKTDTNAGGMSHTPAYMCKKQPNNPDIGPVLQWKESGTRPLAQMFAQQVQILGSMGTPEICSKLNKWCFDEMFHKVLCYSRPFKGEHDCTRLYAKAFFIREHVWN